MNQQQEQQLLGSYAAGAGWGHERAVGPSGQNVNVELQDGPSAKKVVRREWRMIMCSGLLSTMRGEAFETDVAVLACLQALSTCMTRAELSAARIYNANLLVL